MKEQKHMKDEKSFYIYKGKMRKGIQGAVKSSLDRKGGINK